MTYDYKAQRWLHGAEGKALRKVQLTEELALLKGPQGEDYARFINTDRPKAIANIEKSLFQLKN